MNKVEAQKAYAEKRVRKLFAVEGPEAKQHFIEGKRLLEALKLALDIENVFVTFDGENFGIYELQAKNR